MRVIAIVGMAGAGKSEAAAAFEKQGFTRVRFGDTTDEELKRQGMEVNEANERKMRKAQPVVIDGLYSWEEYISLKDYFSQSFLVVAIWASPEVRYGRLAVRIVRPLTEAEAFSRDNAEIIKLNKGGPIAMADYTIINEGSLKDLEKNCRKLASGLKKQP